MKTRGIPLLLVALALAACGEAERPLARSKEGLRFEPEALRYGDVFVESNTLRRVRLQNRGGVSLSLRAATAPPAFEVSPTHLEIEAGAEAEVQIRFRPLRAERVEGAIAFRSASGEEWRLPVEGQAIPIVLSLRASIDFGEVQTGTSSTRDVSIQSLSDAPLDLHIRSLGSPAFPFEATQRELSARATLTLPIAFRPVEAGETAGWLSVQACSDCAEQLVALRGVGLAHRLHPLPDRLDFGQVPTGTTGTTILHVENRGNLPAKVAEVSFERESDDVFSIEGPSLPAVLEPGNSLQWKLTFSPRQDGEVRARLHFLDSAGASLLEVPIVGRAEGPHLHAAPLDFGAAPVGIPVTRRLRLERRGEEGTIVIEDLRFEGVDADDFRIQGAQLPLAVEGDVELDVVYEARKEGAAEASLRIRTSYVGQPELVVPVSALGVESNCGIVTNVQAVHFGLVAGTRPHQRRIELEQVGSDPCLLLEVGLEQPTPDFRLLGAPAGPHLLGPGERVHFFVQLVPVAGRNGWSQGSVTWSWRPDEPEREIPLTAYRADPMPVEVETEIELIETPVGLISFSGLRLSADPPVAVSARLAPGSSSGIEFQEWTGTVGTNTTLGLRFAPEVAGRHEGQIEVLVPGFPEAMRVALRGRASEECEQPCLWPTPRCSGPGRMVAGDEAMVSSGLGDPSLYPDHINCHWSTNVWGSPLWVTPVHFCAARLFPQEAGVFDLFLSVRMGSLGAECQLTVEVEEPPDEDPPDVDPPSEGLSP